jgi:hypothetical protein
MNVTTESYNIAAMTRAIERLAPSAIRENWLGWLDGYLGPGYYNRQTTHDEARRAYTRMQSPSMLLWLINEAGGSYEEVVAVRKALDKGTNHSSTCAAIRKIVPWERMSALLWP